MVVLSPALLSLAPGTSGTFTATDTAVSGGLTFTIASNNTAVVTTSGSGVTPGPVTFTLTAPSTSVGSASVTVGVTGQANESSSLPVAIVPQNANVPNGRSSVAAIATVRRRTGLLFGQPVDTDILAMLNDGLEQVAGVLEPIVASTSLPIVSPLTNILALPLDLERVRDISYSVTSPSQPGNVVYEMTQLPWDEFVQATGSTPAGGTTALGSIPSIYTIIGDASGVQLIQVYPLASTGTITVHYWKRPTLWTLPNTGTSFTDLDSLWQEAAILYACSQACENREDYGTGAPHFLRLFESKMEENQRTVKRRARKPGPSIVRDIAEGDSVVPFWMH